jgi:hypothetical protein
VKPAENATSRKFLSWNWVINSRSAKPSVLELMKHLQASVTSEGTVSGSLAEAKSRNFETDG